VHTSSGVSQLLLLQHGKSTWLVIAKSGCDACNVLRALRHPPDDAVVQQPPWNELLEAVLLTHDRGWMLKRQHATCLWYRPGAAPAVTRVPPPRFTYVLRSCCARAGCFDAPSYTPAAGGPRNSTTKIQPAYSNRQHVAVLQHGHVRRQAALSDWHVAMIHASQRTSDSLTAHS
jgi:hypothetical protein